MAETVKRKWVKDADGAKVAPYTTMDQVIMSNGNRFEHDYNTLKDNLGEIPHFYVGTTTPNNDIGQNGDIYIQYEV